MLPCMLLALAAAVLLYLSHAKQIWLTRALPKLSARITGIVLLAASLFAGLRSGAVDTTVYTLFATLMLVWSLLPFIALLWKPRHEV